MKKGEIIEYNGYHIKKANAKGLLNYRVVEFGLWFRTLAETKKMIDTHIKNEEEHNYIEVKF
jgi:hypothetical protein